VLKYSKCVPKGRDDAFPGHISKKEPFQAEILKNNYFKRTFEINVFVGFN